MKKLASTIALALLVGCAPVPANEKDNGPILSVEITPANPSVEAGNQIQLEARAVHQNGYKADITANASWKITSQAVATVSVDGLVTGVGAGSTEVTAEYKGMTSSPEIISVFGDGGTPTPTPGNCDTGVEVVISEVGYDTPVSEANTEFVEIANPNGTSVDISGYVLTDGESSFTFPASSTLAGNAYLYVARGDATSFAMDWNAAGFAGLTPDFENGGWSLANTGDEMELRDCEDTLVDVVIWEAGTTPPAGWTCGGTNPDSGTNDDTIARDSNLTDTDTCADWSTVTPNPGQSTP